MHAGATTGATAVVPVGLRSDGRLVARVPGTHACTGAPTLQ